MKILYICTHNRCRSILCEALTNHHSQGLIQARSAGSQPSGEIHPLTLLHLDKLGVATTGLLSQSWDEHEDFQPDLVVTVCDSAAGEACPAWFGQAVQLHWGLEDPSKVLGQDAEIHQAFEACIQTIRSRITQLTELASQNLNGPTLKQAVMKLGAIDGSV